MPDMPGTMQAVPELPSICTELSNRDAAIEIFVSERTAIKRKARTYLPTPQAFRNICHKTAATLDKEKNMNPTKKVKMDLPSRFMSAAIDLMHEAGYEDELKKFNSKSQQQKAKWFPGRSTGNLNITFSCI